MAASFPRKSNDCGVNLPQLMKPISRSVTRYMCDYDIRGITKMLLARDGDRSFLEKKEEFKKILESFKKPRAHGALLNEDDEEDEDEDDEEDEDEDNKDDDEDNKDDDEKPDVELQVHDEGERESKKPRLSESFECQGLGEEIEARDSL